MIKIDLNNADSKQAALDALDLIISSRLRKIRVKPKRGQSNNDNNQAKLKMPKNVEVVDVDQEERNEAEQNKSQNQEQDNNDIKSNNNSSNNQDSNSDQKNTNHQANDSGKSGADGQGKSNWDAQQDEEQKIRVAKLNKLVSDPNELDNELANIKLDKQEKQDKIVRANKAAQRAALEKAGRSTLGVQDFSKFTTDLLRTVKSQVSFSKRPESTYKKVNPTYAGTDILMPGSGYVDKKNIPIINVYWDASGSISESQINKGRSALKVLADFERRKLIKINNYWFADIVVDSPDKSAGYRTGAFPKILKHIEDTKANNVIIFTDDDFDRQTSFDGLKPITIKGCVWWIWADNEVSSTAIKYIRPLNSSNLFEYSF